MTRLMLAILLLMPASVAAQPVCMERAEMLKQLGRNFQERPTAVGMANNGGIIEVLTERRGRTWTVILSMPNGFSCVVAAGHAWVNIAPKGGKI
jgi:hypothetical protein